MRYNYSFSGSGMRKRYKVGASLSAGQAVSWITTGAGSVQDPAAVTTLADIVGVTLSAATYSTTQADDEGVVDVEVSPHVVFRSRVSPDTTTGTAFADGDGWFLTNETASAGGTLISDSAAVEANDDVNDGMVFALSGANVGQSRVATDAANNTSVTVTVPFDNAIAVGDTFLVTPLAPGVRNTVQFTTDFVEITNSEEGANGGSSTVVDVFVYTDGHDGSTLTTPILYCDFVFTDHAFSPLD